MIHALMILAVALAVWGSPRPIDAADAGSVRVLDAFVDIAAWTAQASDDERASVHAAKGVGGGGLRLDLDLAGTAGYAAARRGLAVELPGDDGYAVASCGA